MSRKLPLTAVEPAPAAPQPPRPLGKHGLALWRKVQHENEIRDVGGREVLAQCCAALDRAESLRAQIDRDGEMIPTAGGGFRDHPGLRHEIQARAFVVRTMTRLGLTSERIRPPGRPPHGGVGVTWRQMEQQKPWLDTLTEMNADAEAAQESDDESEGESA
jgi:hypothetical protein